MKILLDEQLPVKLKYRFLRSLQVLTVRDLHWLGMKDQQLFSKMQQERFDFFITNDQNLKFQINDTNLAFNFIDLNFFSNRYPDLITIMSALNEDLSRPEKFAGSKGIYIMKGRLEQRRNIN